jgi:Zn-dependent protease with chaperone function
MGGVSAMAAPASAQRHRPFCGYSLRKGWIGKAGHSYVTHRPKRNDKSGVPQVIERIYESLRIEPDIEIYLAEREDNAFATVAGGKKIIVVDVDFVARVNRQAKTEWGAIQVIAHELGHHIAGFNEDAHRAELNADYWSGQALQRLGAGREAATKAILAIGTETDTDTHPSKYRRAATIEKGWDDALSKKIDYGFCDDCK